MRADRALSGRLVCNSCGTPFGVGRRVNNKKASPSKAVGMPIKFSKSKTEKSKGAPDLGEHTREIMQNFGYKDEEIDDFYNKKIIL